MQNIYTDSLSSIKVLQGAGRPTKLVLDTKKIILANKHLFSLNWVKAHCNILGNEYADRWAKIASIIGTHIYLPIPNSKVTYFFKTRIKEEWTDYWHYAETGRRTFRFLKDVSHSLLINNRYLIFFLTGHGPFLEYLNRFNIKDSPVCPCGVLVNDGLGDPDHYVFHCIFTKDYHLTKPSPVNEEVWFKNVLKNPHSINLLINCIKISEKICNT